MTKENNIFFDKEIEKKFANEVDVCVGGEEDFNRVGKINTDMAALKYDFTFFMGKDELAKFKGEKP